jgi:hypothetical protein
MKMNRIEIENTILYQRLQNREKELVEILTLYNEALVKIQELEVYKEELFKIREKEAEIYETNMNPFED